MAESIKEIQELLRRPAAEIFAYGKSRIGMETENIKGRYPVEYDPIRRFCHMRNDDNPLYLDPEYARRAGYEDVVCPPLLIGYFAGPGAWPPSEQSGPLLLAIPMLPPAYAADSPRSSINMATEYEFYKTVVVGDRLYSKNRVSDVYIKAIKRDPQAIWQVTETFITNRDGEVVAIARNINVGWKR